MYDTLIEYINSRVSRPLAANEINIIKNNFVPYKLKNGNSFCMKGM